MKPTDIVEGKTYTGSGACWARSVDFLFGGESGMMVHWFTPNTFPVRLSDGRTLHTPNRTCSLAHFAQLAKREMASCP